MDGFAKTLDAFIKAPLWIFFAACLALWMPVLGLKPLREVGITSDMKLIGLPIGFWALCCTAIFLSSLTARGWSSFSPAISRVGNSLWLRKSLSSLSDQAYALLAVAEEDAWDVFEYDPDAPEVRELRNKGMIQAISILRSGDQGDSRVNGGEFEIASKIADLLNAHPSVFRAQRTSSLAVLAEIRDKRRNAAGYIQWARGQL